MKRVIFCIIGWVLVLGLHAQIVENMRIYTDKDCYVAGEDLWIKVCVTDSLSRGSVLSKVAYVEISDTKVKSTCRTGMDGDVSDFRKSCIPELTN